MHVCSFIAKDLCYVIHVPCGPAPGPIGRGPNYHCVSAGIASGARAGYGPPHPDSERDTVTGHLLAKLAPARASLAAQCSPQSSVST